MTWTGAFGKGCRVLLMAIVNRLALARIPLSTARPPDRAPGTATERALHRIWADALRTDRFGVDDDFFDLGGHSLLAARVVAATRDAFGARVPLRVLYRARTIARLADEVERLAAPPPAS